MSSSSTPQSLRKRRDVALGQQIEMLDQRLHRGVIAVEFAELDRQALAQIARADAGRIEFLQHREDRFDVRLRCAKPLGGLSEIGRQIAGIVDEIDQILSDHALRRAGEGDRQLLGEMAAERHLGGDKGFEIVVVVVRRAAAPFGVGGRRGVLRDARRGFGGLLGEDVVEAGIERLLDFGAACRDRGSAILPGRARSRRRRTRGHVGMFAAGFVAIGGRIVGIGKFGRAPAPARRRPAASGPSLARSSSGFRSSSSSTKAERSRLDNCSSLIACINCGVMTSDCDCRNSSLCVSAMRQEPIHESWSDSCLS